MIRFLPHPTFRGIGLLVASNALGAALLCAGQNPAPASAPKPAPAPPPAPDTLELNDGDTLHGKLVSVIGGKVTFHTDSLGDIALGWDKIKELHTSQKFAVLNSEVKPRRKTTEAQIPTGSVDVVNNSVTVHPETGTPAPAIPVKNAQYVVDQPTLQQQMLHEPGFFNGWAGALTAGATLVSATQDQYTATGSLALVRAVPAASWLTPRNRTSLGFSGSYGEISEPDNPTVKTAIYHAGAERDEYFSPRVFALGQVAFDHNFSQGLNLQAAYGGGVGWTVLKKPNQSLDLKATIQYETQDFIYTPGVAPATPDESLVGSTFSANYMAKLKFVTLTQSLAYVPAYNQPQAYSANETDALTFPVYKKLSFTVGTLDSYLNDPPLTTAPPTKPNSFQFTMGVTYTIQSKY